MIMKRRILLSVIGGSILSLSALAQNLDPTVTVVNDYQGKLLEVDKPSIPMAVPDSVSRFNLEFDYSVLETKYKGTSEFVPYLNLITPLVGDGDNSRLYLRAGAGYPAHPCLDLVWSPNVGDGFTLDVYANHRSYWGKYRPIRAMFTTDDQGAIAHVRPEYGSRLGMVGNVLDKYRWSGYDSYSKAGIGGSYNWGTGRVRADLFYEGVAAKDTLIQRLWNSANLSFRINSSRIDDRYFFYDVRGLYSFGRQDLESGTLPGRPLPTDYVNEHRVKVESSFGPVLSAINAVLFDVDADVAAYGKSIDSYAGRFSLTPKYVYTTDRLKATVGAKFEFLLHPESLPAGSDVKYSSTKGQVAYPDIRVDYAAIPDKLNIFAKVGGGAGINAYSDLVRHNHWTTPAYALFTSTPLMDYDIERVNASIGLEGNFGRRFDYKLFVGYSNFANGRLDSVSNYGLSYNQDRVVSLSAERYCPAFAYAPYQVLSTGLKAGYHSERISLDGDVTYRLSDVYRSRAAGFEPSRLSGDVKFVYNWNKRIFAGLSCEGSLNRRGYVYGTAIMPGTENEPVSIRADLPGFVNLGVNFEYRVSNVISVWCEGDNLLNMSIMRSPLYVENGVNFTAGISVNLR